jgi:hypothetical protein
MSDFIGAGGSGMLRTQSLIDTLLVWVTRVLFGVSGAVPTGILYWEPAARACSAQNRLLAPCSSG